MKRQAFRQLFALSCAIPCLTIPDAVVPSFVYATPPFQPKRPAVAQLPAPGAAADKALIDAIKNGDSERAILLIGHGASPGAADDGIVSALAMAAEAGNVKLVRALLDKGAPVQGCGDPNDSPLVSAIAAQNLQIVGILFDHKVSPEATSGAPTTPLIAAIESGNPKIVDIVLLHGADVNVARKDGVTPLIASVATGNITLAKRLESTGAKSGIRNAADGTPLIVYAASSTPAAIQFALDHGDKIDDVGRDGTTPLMAASEAGDLPALDFLISHHASLTKKDSRHETALLIAKASRSENAAKAVDRLKKAGAMETPPTLADAIVRGDALAIRKILEKPNTDPNATDEDGIPPLLLAVQRGDDKTVKMLLDKGANPNAHDPAGRTILAALGTTDDKFEDAADPSPDMIEMLRRAGAESPEIDLITAVEDGDSVAIDSLLQKGTSANAKGPDGKSVLATAILDRKDYNIADRLLKSGAKVNGNAVSGATLLGEAAASGDVTAVRYLLDHGADPNMGYDGMPPLTLAGGRDPAKGTGQFDEIARLLIDKGADVRAKTKDFNTSVLIVVAEAGGPGLLQLVLDRGARADVNELSRNRATPLISAASSGRADNVEVLLKNGATINTTDADGMTPLMWAASAGWKKADGALEVVKVLLAHHPRLDVRDETGRNALMIAGKAGNFEVMEAIRKAGGKFAELDPQQELSEAVRDDDIESVRRSVKRGADVNAKDLYGDQPLHDAAFWGHSEIAALLIEKGAKVMGNAGLPGGAAESPLHSATRGGKTAVVQVLLRAGAPVDAPGIGGETPLMLAAQEGNLDSVNLLLAKGAKIRKADENGRTALMCAALKGNAKLVSLLLARGANANALTSNGDSALLFASESFFGNPDVVLALLNAKADVNVANVEGQTQLMVAAREGKVDLIEILLNHGAKVQTRDKNGKSALDYADERDQAEAKKVLRKAGTK